MFCSLLGHQSALRGSRSTVSKTLQHPEFRESSFLPTLELLMIKVTCRSTLNLESNFFLGSGHDENAI